VTSTNYFALFKARTASFISSLDDTPTPAQVGGIFVTGSDLPCYKS
jgi:hypothetical protein